MLNKVFSQVFLFLNYNDFAEIGENILGFLMAM